MCAAQCLSDYTPHAVADKAVCRSVCEDFYTVCGDDWRRLLDEYDYVPLTADELFSLMGTLSARPSRVVAVVFFFSSPWF
jgi:hypothetical protein